MISSHTDQKNNRVGDSHRQHGENTRGRHTKAVLNDEINSRDELKGYAVIHERYFFSAMKEFFVKLVNSEVLKLLCKEN